MKNSQQPAHPIEFPVIKDGVQQSHQVFTGLTKREYFAGLAMQGLLANDKWVDASAKAANAKEVESMESVIASCAVEFADTLLAELEKPQP